MSKTSNQAPAAQEALDCASLERCPDLVLVTNTSKGRGIFAKEPIAARTVLETCPVLVLHPKENAEHIRQTSLFNYTYNWPVAAAGTQTQALPLGLGSLFNHSNHPSRCNVGWTRNVDPETKLLDAGGVHQGNDSITYVTLRAIQAGEELCISYGPKERLTFVDVEEEEVNRCEDSDEPADVAMLKDVTVGLEDA